jgi:hypothetical protein
MIVSKNRGFIPGEFPGGGRHSSAAAGCGPWFRWNETLHTKEKALYKWTLLGSRQQFSQIIKLPFEKKDKIWLVKGKRIGGKRWFFTA